MSRICKESFNKEINNLIKTKIKNKWESINYFRMYQKSRLMDGHWNGW